MVSLFYLTPLMKKEDFMIKNLFPLIGTLLLSLNGFAAKPQTTVVTTQPTEFAGAIPQPIGLTKESFTQVRIQFPDGIATNSKGAKNPFSIKCSPEAAGFGSWASNETIWTYNFKAKTEYGSSALPGGSVCQISQNEELVANSGQVWTAGSIHYSVTVNGPKVSDVYVAHGFKEMLREKDPLFIIVFDGEINQESIFGKNGSYLNYTSSNAPSEKIPLKPIPADQTEKIFSEFKSQRYFDAKFTDKNWVLATVKQNLIPGATLLLNVQNQVSAINANVQMTDKFSREFTVRNQFQAEVQCQNPSANLGVCLPQTPITIALNGRVKWTDIRKAYIEYIPYKSEDKKRVQTYAELPPNQEIGLWDTFFNSLSEYFPYLAKYSDTVVDSVVFNVKIEPETQAEILIPKGLKDLDGRKLSNALTTFHIRVGSMVEWLSTPPRFAIYERNQPKLAMPVGIVNLHQEISIRRTGNDEKTWSPITDVPTIINLIRGYEDLGFNRSDKNYVSPMDDLKIKNSFVRQTLKGKKNRPETLQFPFENNSTQSPSGVYGLEISSASLEASESDVENESFLNPKVILAQVTDLSIHIKKGTESTVVWVTHLSTPNSVPGAEVNIYNCLGEKVDSYATDKNGLVTIKNKVWAADCKAPENRYSSYYSNEHFYVSATSENDFALAHTSWTSPNSFALSAPGVDYYYSDLIENSPHFHSIIGVNLVKPGQTVPIQIVARTPVAHGFQSVSDDSLPKTARIRSYEDYDVYFDFPITWANGSAEITWVVPNDTSVKLGSYSINLIDPKNTNSTISVSGEIEVAEFKIPLMTGILGFPNLTWVKPETLPVHTIVRYANGVGAKNLSANLSYYFEPTTFECKDLADFDFGTGPVKIFEDGSAVTDGRLPNSDRPSTLESLKTEADGSIAIELAKEAAPQGGTVKDVLKTMERPQKMVVRVRYQDQMGEFQTLSQAKEIFNSDEYVGTHLIAGSRKDARLQAAVVNVEQKNVTNLSDLDFQVSRIETKVIGEELFGGLIKNTIERQLKPVRWTNDCQLNQQIVSCSVGALKAGNYAYQVTSKSHQQVSHILFKVDAEGRVYGRQEFYNFGDEDEGKYLPLALNKPTYKHGEKAVVSFSSPFKTCNALVTIERNNVMDSFISDNACQKGFVEVPITSEMAPNVFVSIYAITGRVNTGETRVGEQDLGRPTYRLGFANIKVDWSQFKSQVKVTLNQDTFEPGKTVEVKAEVKAEQGELSASTVTFVAIEEKILELKANDTYQILNALMQLRDHNVYTITSLENIQSAFSGTADAPEKTRKGGDEGGDGSSKSEFKRKLFNALVAFKTNVPVENGVAKFSFKANDSLTKFKVFAIAIDANNKFGTGEVSYLSSQSTQTYSNIPAVAYTGDEYPLKVTIQNNAAKEAQFRAEITAVLKDKNGNVIGTKTLTKTSSIAASGSNELALGSIAVTDDTASVQYTVRVYDENGKLVDVLEPEAQIILASVPVTIQHSYLLAMTENTFSKTLVKPEHALAGQGEIQIGISNSLVGSAIKQIQSNLKRDAFADLLIESKFYKAFILSSAKDSTELKNVLTTMIGYTDSNGLLKYYPQAPQGDIFLTARILNTLQTRKWALALLPTSLKEKLKAGAVRVLKKLIDPSYVGKTEMAWAQAQMAIGQSAFALGESEIEALAINVANDIADRLAKDPMSFGIPFEKWTNSDLTSLWLLQLHVNKEVATSSVAYKALQSASRLLYIGNSALLNGSPSYSSYYSDETIETAQLLLGHSKLNGNPALAQNLAAGLVNASAKGWYNTSTLASITMALEAFASAYEATSVTGTTQVVIAEQQASSTIDWSQGSELTAKTPMVTPWKSDKATVQVNHSGAGHPWVGIQALAAVPLDGPLAQGISITKTLKNLTHDDGFQTGDVIEVELSIDAAAPIRHVGLQDPIPSGSNILNQAYGSYSSGEKKYSGYWLYFSRLDKGLTTVKYQFQLNNQGTFKMAPTRAQGIYTPSVFAETPNSSLTIK